MDAALPVQAIDVLTDDVLELVLPDELVERHVSHGGTRLLDRHVERHPHRAWKCYARLRPVILPLVAQGLLLPAAWPRRQLRVVATAIVRDAGRGRDAGACEGDHALGLLDHLNKLVYFPLKLLRRVPVLFLLFLIFDVVLLSCWFGASCPLVALRALVALWAYSRYHLMCCFAFWLQI